MNIASFELVAGLFMVSFGLVYGGYHWRAYIGSVTTPTGIVMLAMLPVIIDFQLLFAFLAGMANVPYRSVSAGTRSPGSRVIDSKLGECAN